ncbi:MAG: TIGR01777 family oxidoreductase [Pseudomonadota bacterium]
MLILLTGSSGLIGRRLQTDLTAAGHQVICLLRQPHSDTGCFWQPERDLVQLAPDIRLDAVIHLAGAGIAEGRWTQRRKNLIRDSRVQGTAVLCRHLAQLAHPPKVLLSGSAIGFYGDTQAHAVDESAAGGTGFLAEVAQAWEAATQPAQAAGIRTIHLRTGIVLSPDGGALSNLLLPFRLGLGGRIGSGQQYMSWVSLPDISRMIQFVLTQETLSGPVNLVAPNPVTQETFAHTLGRVLRRPTCLPLPAGIARLLLGEMADALLLASHRVQPRVLRETGYPFFSADLEPALSSLLT